MKKEKPIRYYIVKDNVAKPINPYHNGSGEYWEFVRFRDNPQQEYKCNLPDGEYYFEDVLINHDFMVYNKTGVWIENESLLWHNTDADRLVVKFEDRSTCKYTQKKWPKLIVTHILILPL